MDEDARKRIDEALSGWRQGDCVLGELWFLFRLEIEAPLTEEAAHAADEGADAGEAQVRGFMVATQTCDIVRGCSERPFIEVCPLVKVDPKRMEEVRRGRRPNYAFVPGVADHGLVADLDRVMTVEKSVVAAWPRTEGCHDDGDVRLLSLALARKRARVAFPDDFVALASNLMRRMASKHAKDSDEGRALRALREIRVRAAPSWDADEVALMFWFIRNDDEPHFEEKGWDHYLDDWLRRLPPGGRFTSIEGLVQTLDDLTARDYVESDPLDLDHLSTQDSTA
ncbi:MAG: hypothetical protein D6705_18670 [Deltaproteobacteria bacterium]|nr:MAG: hypothetical protein D6705_18670 [Deltaproteobacteria bacterium]